MSLDAFEEGGESKSSDITTPEKYLADEDVEIDEEEREAMRRQIDVASARQWKVSFLYAVGTPNEPAFIPFEDSMVASLEYVTDEELVRQAAEALKLRNPEDYEFAIKVEFSDLGVVYWPFEELDTRENSSLTNFLRRYIKKVKEWGLKQDRKNPSNYKVKWEDDFWGPPEDFARWMEEDIDEDVGKYDIIERYSAVKVEEDEGDYSWMEEW